MLANQLLLNAKAYYTNSICLFRYKIFLIIYLAIFLLSCGSEKSISLSADPSIIPADGSSYTLLIASVKKGGDAIRDDEEVLFITTMGSFDQSYELKEISVPTKSGKANTKLYASYEKGFADIKATYAVNENNKISTSLKIRFGNSQPASAADFGFICNARNIGGLFTTLKYDVAVECNIEAYTINHEPIINPQITYMVEAGEMRKTIPEEYGSIVKHYYYPNNKKPKDVEPMVNEPFHLGNSGKTQNPRDGLSTVVASIRGFEAFDDSNGNNQYDEGLDFFYDLPEPFLDKDDNGKRDNDEQFIDSNNNGVYDEANSKWDSETMIWKSFKILLTGPIDEAHDTSRIVDENENSEIKIANCGSKNLLIYVVDENLNPIATNNEYDMISIEVDGYVKYNFETEIKLKNVIGMDFEINNPNPYLGDGKVMNNFYGTIHTLKLEDSDCDYEESTDFNITAEIYYTPAPPIDDLELYHDESITHTLKAFGEID